MERLGYYAFVLLIFFRYSRVIESYGSLHIPMILLLFAMGVAVMRGSVLRGLYHRLGIIFLVLTCFMILSAPFSYWPGGSIAFLKDQWLRTVFIFFLAIAYLTTWKRVRTLLAVIATSFVIIAVRTILSGAAAGGDRAGAVDNTFGNPNDLAMAMLLAIPLCMWMAMDKRSSALVRLGFLGAIPILAFPMSQTGSRMMVLCSGLMGLYLLVKLRGPQRVALIGGGALMVMFAVATMPATSRARIMTLFTGGESAMITSDMSESERAAASASTSSSGRLHLLQQSIRLALDNPILGVGINMFSVAENELAVNAGQRRGHWQVAHNSYTEVASECGIPALIAYLMFLFGAWKVYTGFEKLKPDDHPDWKHYNLFGWTIKTLLFNYMICSFFLSVGYQDLMPTIVAIGIATEMIIRRDQMMAARMTAPEPVVEPTPLYGYGPEAVAYSSNAAPQGD